MISMDERRRYTLPEVAQMTNMSLAFWRKQVWLGRVEVERFGRAIRVTQTALDSYLTSVARSKARGYPRRETAAVA